MTARQVLGTGIAWVPLAFLVDGVTLLLLPVRLAGAGESATVIGLTSFLGLGVALAVQPFAGHLSDRVRHRFDRRRFMLASGLVAAAGLWLFAGVAWVPLAIIGYVVLQAGASALQSALQALIPDRIAPAVRGRAAGWKTTFDVGGAFLAFGVIGLLAADGSVVAAAAVITALLVAALVLVAVLLPAGAADADPPMEAVALASGRLPAGLAWLIGARFLFLLGAFAVSRFLVLLVAERLGLDPATAADEAGLLLATLALITVVAAVPFGRIADRRGRRPVMVVSVVLSAAGIVVLVPAAGAGGVVVGGVLMSLGTAGFVTANWAALTDLTPGPDAGRLMGIANLGTGGAAALAGLAGPVIDAWGFGPALALAAVATALALLPLLVAAAGPAANRRRVRRAT